MMIVEPALERLNAKYGVEAYFSDHGSRTRLNVRIPKGHELYELISRIKTRMVANGWYTNIGPMSEVTGMTLRTYLKNDVRIDEIEELVKGYASEHNLHIGRRTIEYRTTENMHYVKYKLNAKDSSVEQYRLMRSNLEYALTDDPKLYLTEEERLNVLADLDDILSLT